MGRYRTVEISAFTATQHYRSALIESVLDGDQSTVCLVKLTDFFRKRVNTRTEVYKQGSWNQMYVTTRVGLTPSTRRFGDVREATRRRGLLVAKQRRDYSRKADAIQHRMHIRTELHFDGKRPGRGCACSGVPRGVAVSQHSR
jgi:hypothetical protein